MQIREVQIEDYIQIKELHEKYNLKILDKVDWSKFWSENPYIKNSKNDFPIGWVVEENKRIVCYLGNIPKEYYYNSKRFVVACSHSWVADSNYGLQAISLLDQFFSQKNVDIFTVTTANKISEQIFKRYDAKKIPLQNYQKPKFVVLDMEKLIYSFLKYKKIPLAKFIKKLLFYFSYIIFYKKLSFWKKINTTKKVELNSKIDEKFDDFWEAYNLNFKNQFLQSRTSNWIKWHIKHKMDEGKAWIMTVSENNKILGYAICLEKNNEKIELKRITLIDFVSLKDNQEVYISLIKNCIEESKKRGYHIFEIIGFKNLKRKIFSNFKTFNRKLPGFPFYYKSKNSIHDNFLKLEETWDPSLIDGDSFL
tara:strand:- start:493 stop:1587 length:1095 start_codon:yes stop_codon:yes gene_type:complete